MQLNSFLLQDGDGLRVVFGEIAEIVVKVQFEVICFASFLVYLLALSVWIVFLWLAPIAIRWLLEFTIVVAYELSIRLRRLFLRASSRRSFLFFLLLTR